MQGLLLEDISSGRVGNLATRRMFGAHRDTNEAATAIQWARHNAQINLVLEKHGWGEIEKKGNDIVRLYKEHNDAEKVKVQAGMTPEQMARASWQFEPVYVDPNEIAGYRQRLQKLDAELRQYGTSVWKDPKTARIANILQTSAEPGRPGYLRDKEQDMTQQLDPFTKYVGQPVVAGIDAFVEGAAQVGIGTRTLLNKLGVVSLDGLTQGKANVFYNEPTSWVQSEDGTWYHNGGKVGAAEVYAGVWHMLTGELIDQQMAEFGDAKARMAMQAAGVHGIAVGLGNFMGSMAAFLGTGAPAMRAGGALTKGLGIAVTGGKAAKSLSRTEKIVKVLAERSGPAAALGMVEAVKTGRVEGYGTAFLHGTIMAVPMMVMGHLGDKLERTLTRHKHIPGWLGRGLAGTVEGIGLDLGTWEAGWQFVKDPTKETFGVLAQQVMVNAIGNGILRGTGVTGAPPVHEFGLPPETQKARKMARRAAAAGQSPMKVATDLGVSPQKVAKLGAAESVRRATVGTEPDVAARAAKDVAETEKELDIEEAGLAMSEQEKTEGRVKFREEAARINEEPDSPEKRAKLIDLLNQSRLAFGDGFSNFAREVTGKDPEMLKELGVTQVVEGAEPTRLEPVEDKPSPAGQMAQEGGTEGLKPEQLKSANTEEIVRGIERRIATSPDPLEDPRFHELPEALRNEILNEPDAMERKRIFSGYAAERRVGGERRKPKLTYEQVLERNPILKERVKEIPELERMIRDNPAAYDAESMEAEASARPPVQPGRLTDSEVAARKRESDLLWWNREKNRAAQGPPTQWEKQSAASIKDSEKMAREAVERGLFKTFDEAMADMKATYNRAFYRESEGVDPERQEMALQPPTAPTPGSPASLRMMPHLEQEHVPGTPRTRLSDVMRVLKGRTGQEVRGEFRKGVGIRGRYSTRGILGWFNIREKVTRLANLVGARRIVVGAHEWAHNMDLQTNATRRIWRTLSQAEAQGFINAAHPYYPGYANLPASAQAAESWAEFWARHILDDPLLRQETGAFHDWAMRWITDPARAGILARVNEIQTVFRNYRDQGAIARGEAAIHFHDDRLSLSELQQEGILKDTPFHRAIGAVRKILRAIDKAFGYDLRDLEAAQIKALRETRTPEETQQILEDLPITANAPRFMQAVRMTASKQADRFLSVGTHDAAGHATGEGVRQIQADVGKGQESRNFWNWLRAKQELEMEAQGLITTLSHEDNVFIIDRLNNPRYEGLARRLKSYSDRVIDYGVESGLWSAEQGANIKGGYKYYFPIQRVLEGPESFAPGRGVAERGTGMKERKGSFEEYKDPLDTLANFTRITITKAQQSMAVKAMVKFGIMTDGVGSFITEVKRDVIPHTHIMADVVRALKEAIPEGASVETSVLMQQATEIIEKLSDTKAIGPAIELFSQQVIPKGSRAIVAHRPHFREDELAEMTPRQRRIANDMNGKLMWLELDIDAFDAVRGIDTPQTIVDQLPAFIQKFAEGMAKLQRFGAVVISPAYIIRNAVRDVATSSLYTKQPSRFGIISAFGRMYAGAADIINKDPAALQYENIGGGASTYFSGEVARGRSARDLAGAYAGWYGNFRRGVHALTDFIGKQESLLREQAFKHQLTISEGRGRGGIDAALEALEASKQETTDLTKGGTIAHSMNRLVPFFRAGIAGSRQYLMTLAGKNGPVAQRNAWIRGFVNITVPSIFLWWLNHDKKWYQELPAWERHNFWHIDLSWMGIKEPVRIAKPFEIGKIMGSMPEAVLDEVYAKDPIGVANTAWDAALSLVPQQWLPSVLQPYLEWKTNYDFFNDREVVPGWLMNYRLPKDQATVYTRWYAKMLAEALGFANVDISPIRIENTLDTMTGGLVGRSSDLVGQIATLSGALTEGGFSPREIPFIGTLFRRGRFTQSRSVQQVFDLEREFAQRAGSKVITPQEEKQRKIITDAKEEIGKIKAMARAGKLDHHAADERTVDIARRALTRIGQRRE